MRGTGLQCRDHIHVYLRFGPGHDFATRATNRSRKRSAMRGRAGGIPSAEAHFDATGTNEPMATYRRGSRAGQIASFLPSHQGSIAPFCYGASDSSHASCAANRALPHRIPHSSTREWRDAGATERISCIVMCVNRGRLLGQGRIRFGLGKTGRFSLPTWAKGSPCDSFGVPWKCE